MSNKDCFIGNMMFLYIEYKKLFGKEKFSNKEFGTLFQVSKLTVRNWLGIGKKYTNPKKVTVEKIVLAVKNNFGWDITANDLLYSELQKKYSISKLLDDQNDKFEKVFSENLTAFSNISFRLKQLRLEKKLTLMEVSEKVKILFEDEKDLQISHTHIRDIEESKVINYHVNKLRALATVYGETLEYVLFGTRVPKEISIDRDKRLIMIPMSETILGLSDDKIKFFLKNQLELLKDILSDRKS